MLKVLSLVLIPDEVKCDASAIFLGPEYTRGILISGGEGAQNIS